MPIDTDSPTRSAEIETVLQHYRSWREDHDAVDDANNGEKAGLATAKAAGVHIKAMNLAHKIVKLGPREGKTLIDKLNEYVDAISGGMLSQGEMFSNSNEPLDDTVLAIQREWIANRDAKAAGYAAGKNGEPVDNNPHHQGSSQHDLWAREWADGHEDFVATKGTEIHPKKDSGRPEDRREDPEDAP